MSSYKKGALMYGLGVYVPPWQRYMVFYALYIHICTSLKPQGLKRRAVVYSYSIFSSR
jgi:hypothetical protein